jgi:hypothetical protein
MLHKIGDHYINLDGLAFAWVNPQPEVEKECPYGPNRAPHVILRWVADASLRLYDADARQVIALLEDILPLQAVLEKLGKYGRDPDVPAQSVSERA